MKTKLIISIFVIISVVICTFSYTKENKNIEEIHIVISMSGNIDYKNYYQEMITDINEQIKDFTIVPTFAQTDTEGVLKLIYDKENDEKFDFALIQPEYVNSLKEQNLVSDLNDIISETFGMSILDQYKVSFMNDTLIENYIWSLPFIRDTHVLVTEEEGLSDAVYISDLIKLDNLYIPSNKIANNILHRNIELKKLSEAEFMNVISDLSIIREGVKLNRFIEYSELSQRDNLFLSDNKNVSLVVNSIALNSIDKDYFLDKSVHSIKSSLDIHMPVLGSNLFLVSNKSKSEYLEESFRQLILYSRDNGVEYNIPIYNNDNKSESDYLYQNYDYDNNYMNSSSNLSVIEARINNIIISILSTEFNILALVSKLVEELSNLIN